MQILTQYRNRTEPLIADLSFSSINTINVSTYIVDTFCGYYAVQSQWHFYIIIILTYFLNKFEHELCCFKIILCRYFDFMLPVKD